MVFFTSGISRPNYSRSLSARAKRAHRSAATIGSSESRAAQQIAELELEPEVRFGDRLFDPMLLREIVAVRD
jgi:hypothetical protein